MSVASDPQSDVLLFQLLLSPESRADPYPMYRELRERAPVHRSSFGPLVLSRYADCVQALRDPNLGRATGDGVQPQLRGGQLAGMPPEVLGEFRERARRTMLFQNPPEHTRLRRLVSRAFTPNRAEEMRPAVAALLRPILDELAGAGSVDVMRVLAFPLPVAVIGELLGVPTEDRPGFQPLVRKAVAALDPTAGGDAMAEAFVAQDEMSAYMGALLEERRRRPQGDLLSGLATAREADDRLTEEEIVATALLLFAAGFETTTNLIGNGLLALLRHPDELARLRAEPGLMPLAVEEMLRFDSPVQLNARAVLAPTEVAGERIEPGDAVVTLLGGANRDPERFAAPDAFDVGRPDPGPISFGGGIHYCLGAGLARVEGQVVFAELLDRFSSIELTGEPAWRPQLTLRGLDSLPVALA